MHFAASAQSFPFPTDNLQLWLRADSVELTDGKVSRWFDQSPNQYEIVQTDNAAKPTVAENALNGQPVLFFNGSSTFLSGGDILDLDTNKWTWFIVGQYNNPDNQLNNSPMFVSKYDRNINWGAPMYLFGQYVLLQYWQNGNGSGQQVTPFIQSISSNTEFQIFSYELRDNVDGYAHDRAYLNSLLVGDIQSQPIKYAFNSNCPFKIGHIYITVTNPKGTFLNGHIAEIIAFNTIDTDLQNKVYNYLEERYFPEFTESVVNLDLDIRVPYGFADTALTTAYRPDFTSYLWSTGESDSVIHVSKPGTYWVTVTNTFGYTSSDTINVYYPEPVQLRDTTICAGDTIVWDTELGNGYSFLWSDGSAENSLEITTAGKYYVTITDSLGHSWKSDTITVMVDDYPTTTFFADGADSHTIDTALCSGNALGLASNADVTTSYQWSTGTSSARIALTQSGDYTLVSANARGCRAINTAHVTIKGEAPRIGFDINGLCLGDTTAFSGLATSEQGIESYLWIINRTDSVSGQSFRHRFAEAGRH